MFINFVITAIVIISFIDDQEFLIVDTIFVFVPSACKLNMNLCFCFFDFAFSKTG